MFVVVGASPEPGALCCFRTQQFPAALARDPPFNSPWIDHINRLREDLGLSVGALVEALGVSRQTFYDRVRGELPNSSNQVRIGTLASIASEWSALGLGPMSRDRQLPGCSPGASLRNLLSDPNASVTDFLRLVSQLGLARRLLPPRSSKPRLISATTRTKRRTVGRKPWHIESDDHE